MIKVAIFADHHFDETSRFDECVRVHDWLAEDLARRGVDLALSGGDVYERKSTPRERRAVAAWAQRVATQCPLVIVRGNHDALQDLPLLEKLHTLHPITVVEDARVVEVAGCVVGCLGWPNKANILALAGAVSRDESEQTAREALRDVMRGLGQQMRKLAPDADYFGEAFDTRDRTPRILLAHAMVCGSTTSVGQPLVGCDLEVALEDLALAGADLYALGHIHKGQQWEQNDRSPVVYPGSPRRTAFGEVESKGYILATFEGADLVSWERIETPCAPMLLIETQWDLPEPVVLAIDKVQGAEVRIRYSFNVDMAESARLVAESWKQTLLENGETNVKLGPPANAQCSAPAPEVAKAATIEEKLARLWEARGTTPDDARAARLVSMAKSIESEAAGAI